jgi:hypothetical protein
MWMVSVRLGAGSAAVAIVPKGHASRAATNARNQTTGPRTLEKYRRYLFCLRILIGRIHRFVLAKAKHHISCESLLKRRFKNRIRAVLGSQAAVALLPVALLGSR